MWFVFWFVSYSAAFAVAGDLCTYETWDWDVVQRRAVNQRRVVKPRSELSNEERGLVEGCSVCQEDQDEVRLEHVPVFKVCRRYRAAIENAVKRTVREGFEVRSVVGYRVGRSKGTTDAAGKRTEFSNHSFGTAVDFNAESNGLYDQCLRFGPGCRLVRGGAYHGEGPGVISRDTALYREMKAAGFKWGGEIEGRQKDFMHFSFSGY